MNKNMFMVIDSSSSLRFGLLTKHRIPGAIPILGRYRMIDFSLSNAANSNITNVGIFPYGNYRSLVDHIGSGNRYNLNRRIDGVFTLPSKTDAPVSLEFLTFKRMFEQREFFTRSTQDYVVICPDTLIWITDYRIILDAHISSGADITQVVKENGERLYAFILSKKLLVSYIDSYNEISFKTIVDVFDHAHIKTNNYVTKTLSKYIRSTQDYYNFSMDIIELEKKGDIHYSLEQRVRTKDYVNPPTYFGENAVCENVLSSSGAVIKGKVENSILSRRVVIEEGAFVKNSIIMNNATIESGAYVENAIIDKESVVKSGATIKGTKEEPFVSEKRQIITSQEITSIVMLSAECSPFIKVGGLADMVGSLSRELAKLATNVKVFIPLYKEIKDKYISSLERDHEISMKIENKNYHINTYRMVLDKVTYIFVDLYMFFERDKIYGYEDDPSRFAYFCDAVAHYLLKSKEKPDIFHMHDWHTALFPLFKKKYHEFDNAKTILTIHNLNYQGEAPKKLIDEFGFDYYQKGNIFNILEAGIYSSNQITTVSKTYAEELKYAYYSGNLQEAILTRQRQLYGITNGLDEKFNPSVDLEIQKQYDVTNVLKNKPINKKYLCKLCGFEEKDSFVIGMVSRLAYIKGFDLVLNSLDEILEDKRVKFVVLGVGDESIMNGFRALEARHPSQMKCFLDFWGTRPEYIYAGADAFLMPSRIEPCGTSQMIALKYGTVPIVRQTGGLNDTVRQFKADVNQGNGFKFYNYDASDLIYTISNAKDTFYNNKEGWNSLIINGMNTDCSFEACAKDYLYLYNNSRKEGN